MLVIRKFREEDNAVLASIYLGCRTETFHWVSGDSFKLEDFTNDTLGEAILVAVNDGEIVGFVSLWLPDNFIHHLFIHAKYQKRGAGGRLLDEALRLIGRPARLKCVIQNRKACMFYEKRGWTVESSTMDGPMGPYHTYRCE